MIELKHQIASMTTPPPVPVEGEAAFVQDSDDSDSLASQFDSESLLQKGANVKVNRHTVLTQEMLKGADMDRLLVVMTKTVESFSKHLQRSGTGFMQQDPLAGLGSAAGGEGGAAPEEEDVATTKQK